MRSRGWVRLALASLLWLAGLALLLPAHAQQIEFSDFEVSRSDDGVQLSFGLRFELPRGVEDALLKGVPLYFVAEAEVLRERWYWRDRRVAKANRVWRVAYQPLTRKYRVTFGALNQTFDSVGDALATVRRVNGWKIAETSQLETGGTHYVEFTYRLDTTLLPRPMQIGISGQPDWSLSVERTQRFN